MKRWQAQMLYWPTLGYNYFLGRVLKVRRWWDHVDKQVILGARPFRRDAKRLREAGVTGVVNMCEEYHGPIREYERLGIEQLHLPTVDFNHPAEEHVEAGAAFIEKHVSQGGVVYVHCKAGRARSATIVLWWLVRYRQMTPQEAQAHLIKYREHINPKVYLRPVVQTLYARFLAAQGSPDPVGEAQAAVEKLP
ncbi:MAG: dual specificity protein phosphatase family protein [Pirellulaceae bacterium]|nr:dual specificity protein phosphatase family protein [Pirellulaceae bacterium]